MARAPGLEAPSRSRGAARGGLAAGLTALVLVAAGAICLLGGVSPLDVLLFAGYELAFVLVPGALAYSALASRPGGLLRRVSIGAAVGLSLELTAFMATAAAGARDLFLAYPLVVLLAFGPLVWRRWRRDGHPGEERFSPRQVSAVAAVGACALLLFAAGCLSQAPLPGEKPSVSLYPDLVWGIGFAAEAKHHWPLTTPQVSGEPLRYHTFVFMHMAATSQVTGIELPAVALVLVSLPLLLLLLLQLAYAGRHLTGRPWAGPLAAALVLLGGDLDLAAPRPEPLMGFFFTGLFLSPSFLFGLVLFLPAAVWIRDLIERAPEGAGRLPPAGDLVVLALLLVGCAGAKASMLPVLLGGLVLVALRPGVRRPSLQLLALTAAVFLVSYLALYSGSRGASELGPFESSLRLLPGARFRDLTEDGFLGALVGYPLATVVTLLALMPTLAGLVWIVRGERLSDTQAWLLGLLLTSLAAFLLLDLPGVSQVYFLWYGFAAGVLVSAEGLMVGWEAWARRGGPSASRVAVAVFAAIALVLGFDIRAGGQPLPTVYVALLLLLGGILVACAVGLLDCRARHAGVAALAAGALVLAGAIDGPLDRLPRLARRALDPEETVHRPADPVRARGVTRELADGLAWIRDNTPTGSVLAVNNHLLTATGDSRFFYYSALAERRVYLEAWDYTDRSLGLGLERVRAGLIPYPARLRANDAAFMRPDRSRLKALRRAGVTHLVVDRVNGRVPPSTRALRRPAYDSAALSVYRISG